MPIGTWPAFLPDRQSLFDLVRLPAVLSVPGDTLAGAAAADFAGRSRAFGVAASSCCLYWAGMALNDYADRDVDAQERPQRPIPSGRVSAQFALRFAQVLTAAGIGVAALSGGRRAAITSTALAASVWSYDLSLKHGPAGPVAMAACRSLDVLLGAGGGRFLSALPAAGLVGAHTLVLTTVSRQEVDGGSSEVPRRAKVATVVITTAAAAVTLGAAARKPGSVVTKVVRCAASAGLVATYAVPVLKAQDEAIAEPVARNMGRVVGTSIQAMIPLQGALLASRGRLVAATVISGGWPLARKLTRKRAIT